MRCPFCKEEIQDGAIKCKHCGEVLRKEEYSQVRHERTKALSDYSGFSDYYQRVFTSFDQQGGGFQAKWNWAAFLFGAVWYLVKGIWIKALLMFVIIFVFWGIPALFFWLYAGIAGNWDYYLLKVKGKHFW
jgi:hypothetical protein